MPNFCDYEMRVRGKKENVEKFIDIIKCNYDYSKKEFTSDRHLSRVFEANSCWKDEEYELHEYEDGTVADVIYGYCAWSVYSCMMEGERTYYRDLKERYKDESRVTSLIECSKDLDLDIEAFSEELGFEFMEHFLIRKGVVEIDDCVEYKETYNKETDEYETEGGLEWDYQI